MLRGTAKVLAQDGSDRTREFIEGAKKVLEAARECGAKRAYMKSKSPSCGCSLIYDGTFSGTLKPGAGVTAALLKQNGIEVIEKKYELYGRRGRSPRRPPAIRLCAASARSEERRRRGASGEQKLAGNKRYFGIEVIEV